MPRVHHIVIAAALLCLDDLAIGEAHLLLHFYTRALLRSPCFHHISACTSVLRPLFPHHTPPTPTPSHLIPSHPHPIPFLESKHSIEPSPEALVNPRYRLIQPVIPNPSTQPFPSMAAPQAYSPQGTGARFTEDFRSEFTYEPSATMDPEGPATAGATTPQRSGTLKKKDSVKRKGRSRSGSMKSLGLGEPGSRNSLLYSPAPTHSDPTEILANRVQCEFRLAGW